MLHPVTPYTATVQSDIEKSGRSFDTLLKGYALELYNTGDSLWLTVQWPKKGRIAFRVAFGMNCSFGQLAVNEIPGGVLITATTRLGSYRITVSFPEGDGAIFRYTTTLRAVQPLLIPFWPRDIVPLTKEGQSENTSGTVYVRQEGTRSGQLFFSYTKPETGSVFYFQNLTAMSDYCEATQTTLGDAVGGSWPEVGFLFPVSKEKPLPADTEYTISDAFVVLSESIPHKDHEIAMEYLDHLASVYRLLPKPGTSRHDWPEIAEQVLTGLHLDKGCWRQVNGNPFLNAYVADYKTPPEIMVQLAVKLPLTEYLKWSGQESHPLLDDLNSGLEEFYDDQIRSLVRWHPALEGNLDRSEEQKQEMVMDSWYLHHPLINLARLALMGIERDRKLFLDSVHFAMKVARHFKYEWPVFYKMTTLEVIKSETSPGKGGEKDVPGSYAHLMLLAWQLTRDRQYLNEALTAVKHLKGLVFDIFYQANNTAFSAGALIELYKETKDERLLALSYCCLAGIFRNARLWDCGYGNGKHFPGFFSVFPLNDAPYTAAYEEFEVYAALSRYLEQSKGIGIPRSLQLLIGEFVMYAVGRLAYYYPARLPQEMLSETVKTGAIKKDLPVPLEDIYAGWEQSGQVGQEVYGSGIPFGIVARQYFRLEKIGCMAFTDLPITNLRIGKNKVTFQTLGHPSSKGVLLLQGKKSALEKITIEQKSKSAYQTVGSAKAGHFEISGGSATRLNW